MKGFDQLNGSGQDDRRKKRRTEDDERDAKLSKTTARQAIFEGGNVGVDLRAQGSASLPNKAFMKPAGVDDPKKAVSTSAESIIDGARQKTNKPKNKKRRRGSEE